MDSYLQYVVSRLDVSDINPLAVDVSVVRIVAAWTQTLEKQSRRILIQIKNSNRF